MRPLEGITVVSMEQAVAAPFATRQLADLGARVIKVERPGSGDFARRYDETVRGQSSYFVWLNRSKESLTLDVKTPEGRAVISELIAGADVFVQNLAPGATARLGLDEKALRTLHPELVHCTITGYGTTGDWSHRKAYDLLVQAEAGLLSITGGPDQGVRVGISIADIAAGMYAYSGILAALLHRTETGAGQTLEVSLFEALAEWMGNPAYYTQYGGTPPSRMGAQHATIAPYGPYVTGDGGEVLLAVQNDREWSVLCCDVLERPDLRADPRFITNSSRSANRDVLNEEITASLARFSTGETIDRLERLKIANARINDVQGFLEHPVLASRERWVDVDSPAGSIKALLPPVTTSAFTSRMDAVPALGADTEQILRALGRDEQAIAALRATGII